MGINEYWIVDFKGLGGTAFIGKPKEPTFTVCQLVGEDYQLEQQEPHTYPLREVLREMHAS
jgi:Uma2 family endonuclease